MPAAPATIIATDSGNTKSPQVKLAYILIVSLFHLVTLGWESDTSRAPNPPRRPKEHPCPNPLPLT